MKGSFTGGFGLYLSIFIKQNLMKNSNILNDNTIANIYWYKFVYKLIIKSMNLNFKLFKIINIKIF